MTNVCANQTAILSFAIHDMIEIKTNPPLNENVGKMKMIKSVSFSRFQKTKLWERPNDRIEVTDLLFGHYKA